MQLTKIDDSTLLSQIRICVQSEREIVVKVLRHLREIERRRLFADLGYRSLFDYAVSELKYSEAQAARRIQSMRLIKDLPEVEVKIATGELSLSNAHQVQTFFRNMQSAAPQRIIPKAEKLTLVQKLEGKSVRDGQKELLKMEPVVALPKERERILRDDAAEVRFVMNDNLRSKLEAVRSLLGSQGATLSYAELFEKMSELSIAALEERRFGKRRVATNVTPKKDAVPTTKKISDVKNSRHIPRAMKYFVWKRDAARCKNCGSRQHLQFDHIKPFALGGETSADNLRLLCFSCNQRGGIKTFGVRSVHTQ